MRQCAVCAAAARTAQHTTALLPRRELRASPPMAYSSARGTPGAEARTLAWLYRDSQTGEVLGPCVIETLCTLWRCGELTEESQVKPEGAARFVRVRDAPALLGMLQTQPPSPAALRVEQTTRAGRDALNWRAHIALRCTGKRSRIRYAGTSCVQSGPSSPGQGLNWRQTLLSSSDGEATR